jgi:hypothetical protein
MGKIHKKTLGGALLLAVAFDFVLPKLGISTGDIPLIIYLVVGLYLFLG